MLGVSATLMRGRLLERASSSDWAWSIIGSGNIIPPVGSSGE